MLEYEREFMCNACKHVFSVPADFQQYYSVCRPDSCPNTTLCSNVANFTPVADKGKRGFLTHYVLNLWWNIEIYLCFYQFSVV